MGTLLRIVAGIIVVDALVVAGLAISVALESHGSRREIRDLERLWRLSSRAPAARLDRSLGRRFAAAAMGATLLCTATAAASPQARQLIASALGPVVREVGGGPAGEERVAAAAPYGSPAGGPSVTPHFRGVSRDNPATTSAGPRSATTVDSAHLTPASTRHAIEGPSTVTGGPSSATAIELAWSDVSGERGFRVERSVDGETGWAAVARTKSDVTAYADTGLRPGTTYFYRVFATDPVGDSPPSDVVSATTGAVPTAPPSVTAVSGSTTEVDLTWADVEDETGYRIERSPDGTGGWLAIASTGQDVASYADTSLSPGTTYFYRIVATGAFGDAAPTAVVSATTSAHPVSGQGDEAPVGDLTM